MIMATNHIKKLSMKKIYRNTGLIIGLFAILLLSACKEKIDPIVEELDFDRAFTPVGLSAQISSITTVTLTWDAVKNAENYVLEIYEGIEFLPAKLVAYCKCCRRHYNTVIFIACRRYTVFSQNKSC